MKNIPNSRLQRLRYVVGRMRSSLRDRVLSSRLLPLSRLPQYSVCAWYDAQRIVGHRQFSMIFDVGANVGQTALSLERFFPEAQIHCFEPASAPFLELSRILRDKPRMFAHQVALGDEDGERTMRVGDLQSSEINTFVDNPTIAHKVVGSEKVVITSLDAFCSQWQIERIDILKMDVQGWELNVLKGGKSLLDRECVDFIFTEASFDTQSQDMVPFPIMHNELSQRGYVISGIYDQFRWGRKAEIYFCNALYCHRRIARSS